MSVLNTPTAYLGGISLFKNVTNSSSSAPINAFTPVYIDGWDATNSIPTVAPADANVAGAYGTLMTVAAIEASGQGQVADLMAVSGQLDTSGAAVGDPVYLSNTVGTVTLTAPTSGASVVLQVGIVISTSDQYLWCPGELDGPTKLQTVSGDTTVAALTITGNVTMTSDAGGVQTIQAGTTNGLQVGTGGTQKLGFYGATPIVQAVLPTGAMPPTTTDAVIQALQDLGLVKQS